MSDITNDDRVLAALGLIRKSGHKITADMLKSVYKQMPAEGSFLTGFIFALIEEKKRKKRK